MFQYIYSPEEAGLSEWPSGTLRLEGFDVTPNPEEADVFVVPGNLSIFKDDLGRLDRLPHIAGREDRLCVFDVSDNFAKALGRKWIIIRCDARDWMLKDDPNSIAFSWPVKDCSDVCAMPGGGFTYDVTFRGWLSTDTRADSARSCKEHPALKSDIATYSDFTGYVDTVGRPEYDPVRFNRLMDEFKSGMRESRVALCPESIPGVLPYRFFEAISAGRVPLLVSSDFIYPFAAQIPYREFVIELPRSEAKNADRIVLDFIRSHSDDEIVEMGRKARYYWELWLNAADWSRTMGWAVRNQLECRKVQCA